MNFLPRQARLSPLPFFIPILQMRKLRQREIKELAQIHETSVWQSLEFILGLTLEQPVFSTLHSSTFPG